METNENNCKGGFGKIFGHKFKPRFSEKTCFNDVLAKRITHSDNVESLKESEKTYVCDVCVRCGKIVKK